MTLWIWIIIAFLVCQRVAELIIARKNEAWMLLQGGVERGGNHYKWFVILHILFFISIITEVLLSDTRLEAINPFLFGIFILTQIARVWCISSLGKFWNTKVIILPGSTLRSSGPYRFVKHPNYLIVGIELFIIPLLLGALYTAIIFPFLHIFILLKWRLPVENQALKDIETLKKG
ncbi:isoprenylcysteine carboxyl methyltransferase family protein [Virgibacillus flavescens]|uniref:isoprenylcysteine carboxyl methyltransferase family protein n=1 Tax=Virgibacillus flavescens TaxID=1611422 RepID=UPI003D33A8DC